MIGVMRFQEKLVKMCEDRGWIQADLARAVKSVSRNTVSRWWNGEVKPFDDEALVLARILGCPLDYLADDAQDEPPRSELLEDEAFILDTYRGLRDNQGMTREEARDRLMARTAEALGRLLARVEGVRASPVDPPEATHPGGGPGKRIRVEDLDLTEEEPARGRSADVGDADDPSPGRPGNPVPKGGRG